MGLWSLITGANKVGDAIDTGLDLAKMTARGIDAMVHTSQEKAIEAVDLIKANMAQSVEMAKLRQSESGASAQTRRAIGYLVFTLCLMFAAPALFFAIQGDEKTLGLILLAAQGLKIPWMGITVVAGLYGYYSLTGGKR